VDRAIKTCLDEKLQEAKWNPAMDIPDDIWEGWCDGFREARELLEDIPLIRLKERRLRTPGFFEDLKKEWNGLMHEVICASICFEERFGDLNDPRHQVLQARNRVAEAEQKVEEWRKHASETLFDRVMRKPSWDPRRGSFQKSSGEICWDVNE
jgi:hypothetical protein